MPTTFPIFFILLTSSVKCLSAGGMRIGRRILHQPFFPNGLASLPFTTSTPQNSPFFPSFPSPPPPSTFASFPANISSLDVPHSIRSNSASPKLVAVSIVALVAALLFSAAAIFWFCRRRKRLVEDDKTQRSESSHLTLPPKLRNPAATSSEFLYLGTLVNSQQRGGAPSARGINCRSSGSISRKLDSPELRPLPPLVRQQQLQQRQQEQPPQQQGSVRTGDVSSNANTGEEEEFYSPRGSLGRRSNSIGAGSGSRVEFLSAVEMDEIQGKIGKLSSSSSSSSSASSGSPARSPSISISPPASLSPRRPKSPELLVMATPLMPQPPNLRPIMTAQFDTESNSSMSSWPAVKNNTLDSPSLSNDSDERLRSLPEVLSPARGTHFTPPPPPPPPPFMMQWETPKPSPRQMGQATITKPPVLVTPLRPVVRSSNDVSLLELPSAKSDASENNEDTPKPKLKPLHWEKVRANSDKEMVWDQLKSSSFK